MTRDLCYFYPCPLNAVYGAFVQTAAQKLGKDCKQTPMVSISFGLNFSMKYNMNGGACTIHFMPYQNGTAINIRYSVVQLMGARYKKHAQDLTLYANNILRANAQPANINVQEFLNYAATQTRAQSPMAQPAQNARAMPQQTPPQYQPQAAPQTAYRQSVQQYPSPQRPAQGVKFCTYCGKQLPADARFCTNCGKGIAMPAPTPACPNCGKPLQADEKFCVRCGTKIN